jgi:UDP-N-acetylglucosamine diphosphorylase/glucosamine-1-phosphate N-acetyltransferase
MKYILSDLNCRNNFLPLAYTRSVADMRIGILTIKEKWEKYLRTEMQLQVIDYLQPIYNTSIDGDCIIIAANVLPNETLISEIEKLKIGQQLFFENRLIATCVSNVLHIGEGGEKIESKAENFSIENLWDIFSKNDKALREDFTLLTKGKISLPISNTNTIIGSEIFLEEGAKVEASILNATTGPIYIGKNAEIMEGCIVRGGLALCEGAQLKLGTKIYGATTLGPGCKAGGEVNNSVFFANSSKAHDGFLGNSVIGEWCNMGADTNNSNLKNNYEEVKFWSETAQRFVKTGLQFCGLIMADHSKCGINTMFNTGTVVGVSANVFGAGFPRNYIPSFSWGGPQGISEYKLDKAMQTMKLVFARRNKTISEAEENLYAHLFAATQEQRKFI